LARQIAARGYGVALAARREDRLRTLADELATTNAIRAEVLACDLADPVSRAAVPDRLRELGVRVDILINNAGLGSSGRFTELERERELSQVRVMCEAMVDLCSAFVPEMAHRRSGALLIMSSTTAFQPAAKYATYGAAKAFSLAFGQALHADLRSSNVAVTTVCPGPVRTDFFSINRVQAVRLPKAMWTTADDVAHAAIRALERNHRVVIPGAAMRALMAASRLSPTAVQLRVMDLLLSDDGTTKASQVQQA
jgi:short-subunit dehydrogenase